MKRFLSFICILSIAFSLVGCGKDYTYLIKHEMLEGVTIGTDRDEVYELYGKPKYPGSYRVYYDPYTVYYDGLGAAKFIERVSESDIRPNGYIRLKYSDDDKVSSIEFISSADNPCGFPIQTLHDNVLKTYGDLYGKPTMSASPGGYYIDWALCNERGKEIYHIQIDFTSGGGLYTMYTISLTQGDKK